MKSTIIMKDNTFFKLFIIILIGTAFRLWFLDKPDGLWNDEYVSWFISSQKDWSIFFSKMLSNCHTPLYYFYLKLWMFIFPDNDISLRWSSILPSIISIIVMFFTGKELKDKNLGILCAIFTALSSFLIYFAQEARLYSLTFLISTLCILFFIKSAKEQTKFNMLMYFSLNAVLCTLHTLGIIFSFFNILCLFYYIKTENKKIDLKYLIPFISVIVIISPLLYKIASSKNLSQFWSEFSFSKILFTTVDYLSPVQTNVQNTYQSFIDLIYNGSSLHLGFIIFAIIPSLIGIYGIINSILKKSKILNALLISAAAFFMVLIILCLCGKMILITKYSIELYPILLLALAFGLSKKRILISIFILLNLFYLLTSPSSAPKLQRPEGHKAVADLIKNSNIKNSDYILLTYYDSDRFERYIDKTNNYKFYSINKFNFNYFLFDGENYFKILKDGKKNHREFFVQIPNKTIEKYIYSNIISKMDKNERLGIIFLNTVSFISINDINEIVADNTKYDKTPLIYLVFSTLKNNLMEISNRELILEDISQKGEWTLVVYKKP